jgi:hypothetical protein
MQGNGRDFTVHSQGKILQSFAMEEDPRWLLAQRVAGSTLFQRSVRLKALLLYVAEQALSRPGEALNEYQIGRAVFERPPEYSPSEDNIVRVQARHLRARLEEYFENEGKAEALILEIPKGGYLPMFRARVEQVEVVVPREAPEKVPAVGWKWAWYAIGLSAAAMLGWLAHGWRSEAARGGPPSWILAALFENQERARMITPDSSFGLLQGFLGRNLTLNDYLRPGYPNELIEATVKDETLRARARSVASRPYTTYGNLLIAGQGMALAERHGWRLSLEFCRQLTPREVGSGNLILVGSPQSNPWVGLFEKDGDFQSYHDLNLKVGGIRNLRPAAGEAKEYVTEPRHGYSGEAYALVGLHVKKGSRVLTLAGTNMEGTEAAWDFVSTPDQAKLLGERAGWNGLPEGEAKLEAVLRTYVLAGAARDTKIVAVRVRRLENGR